MIYDWKAKADKCLGTCRISDAITGEEVERVFYIDTDTGELRRYLVNESGRYFSELDPDDPNMMRAAQVREFRAVVITPLDGSDVPLLAEAT